MSCKLVMIFVVQLKCEKIQAIEQTVALIILTFFRDIFATNLFYIGIIYPWPASILHKCFIAYIWHLLCVFRNK